MTQARAPMPHEVAAKSPIIDHLPGAVPREVLRTASASAQVTHRGEGQIRYEAFRTVHGDDIALREEFRRPPTTPPHASRKLPFVNLLAHHQKSKVSTFVRKICGTNFFHDFCNF